MDKFKDTLIEALREQDAIDKANELRYDALLADEEAEIFTESQIQLLRSRRANGYGKSA